MAKDNGSAKNGRGGRGSRAKRDKSEASTGKKEASAEMRKAGEAEQELPLVINDNDFDMHFKSLKRFAKGMKDAKNAYDGACKAAKKVSPDLLDAIKQAIKDEDLDPVKIRKELELRGYVLRKLGCSIQLTLHDTLLGDVNELATKRGTANGNAGTALNNPYPQGSDLAKLYEDAYVAAQSQKVMGMGGDGRPLPADHNERNGAEAGA